MSILTKRKRVHRACKGELSIRPGDAKSSLLKKRFGGRREEMS